MKKLLTIMMALMAFTAMAQKGESVLGAQAGYTSTNESMTIGVFYQYGITDYLRLAPDMGAVVRHNNLDAFTLDANIHFPLQLGSNNADLYPLAGLNLTAWSRHNIIVPAPDPTDGAKRMTKDTTRLGLNLGAGFGLQASSRIRVKVEAKYVMATKYSTVAIDLGVGYVF